MNDPHPIRIEHAFEECAQSLFVDWQLGNFCNYACSYCPSVVHDGSLPWLDIDSVKRAITSVIAHARTLEKRAHFQFTGGEPTLYPDIEKMLVFIRDSGATVSILSNGTRSLVWWSGVVDCLRSVALSYHLERASIDNFSRLACFLSERLRTHINVTMLHSRFDECLENARQLRSLCPGVSIALKPLRVDFGNLLFPYTPEQLQVLGSEDSLPNPPREQLRSAREAMRVEFSNGTTKILEAGQIVAQGINKWNGWLCYAGMDLLMIDARGRMFRAQCRQGGPFGNVKDEIHTFPNAPIQCSAVACSCHSDIMNRRSKPAD